MAEHSERGYDLDESRARLVEIGDGESELDWEDDSHEAEVSLSPRRMAVAALFAFAGWVGVVAGLVAWTVLP